MSSVAHSKEMRAYYLRKVADGKNKMSVINAVRNKLVLRMFAVIRHNRIYEKGRKFRVGEVIEIAPIFLLAFYSAPLFKDGVHISGRAVALLLPLCSLNFEFNFAPCLCSHFSTL